MTTREKHFRKKLSHALKEGMLNEGLFDDIIGFLTGLEDKWTSGQSDTERKNLKSIPDNLDPGANPQDQLFAVVCVCQAVGYCLEDITKSLEYFNEITEESQDTSEDPEAAYGKHQEALTVIMTMAGRASGWLQNDDLARCSQKVHSIGSQLDPKTTVTDSVKELLIVLEKIESLNIDAEIENILNSPASKVLLEEDPYWSGRGKEFIDQGYTKIQDIGNVIDSLDNTVENIAMIEELIKEKTQETEIAATADVVSSSVFETLYRNVFQEMINGN